MSTPQHKRRRDYKELDKSRVKHHNKHTHHTNNVDDTAELVPEETVVSINNTITPYLKASLLRERHKKSHRDEDSGSSNDGTDECTSSSDEEVGLANNGHALSEAKKLHRLRLDRVRRRLNFEEDEKTSWTVCIMLFFIVLSIACTVAFFFYRHDSEKHHSLHHRPPPTDSSSI